MRIPMGAGGVVGALLTALACSAEFVPFVIPFATPEDSVLRQPHTPVPVDGPWVTVDGEHFQVAGDRYRVWGVNLSFGSCLPLREEAPILADRLAAAGVNNVRLHHLDTAKFPRGIWAEDGRRLHPEALDRLDYFIDQLARHGVRVNLNLHVGHSHSKDLGLPEQPDSYDKIIGIFTPQLIEAQQQYARALLSHRNPYRGCTLAEDPAVAFLEITNEDSLFMWGSENKLRSLHPYYEKGLRDLYNRWLQKRYGTREKLVTAWSEGAEALQANLLEGVNLELPPGEALPAGWHLEQHAGSRAEVKTASFKGTRGLQIVPEHHDGTGWHLQFNQGGLGLEQGHYYTIRFRAAAARARQVSVGVNQHHDPWQNLGLSRTLTLTPDWTPFEMGFVAGASDENARLSLSFGQDGIPFYLSGIEFCPGGREGLRTQEDPGVGTVSLFAEGETSERIRDRMRFLADTERAYFEGMYDFLKDELKARALVTGTIVMGPLGLWAQSSMDFIDGHAYWQHPHFPGRPWDRNNWVIPQKEMAAEPEASTLYRLAAEALAGKPFTVSEYNHPAPNDYQAECVPMIASFAAAQDWDGVWLYTYSHRVSMADVSMINSFFDLDTNPAKWGFMTAGARLFTGGGMGPMGPARTVDLGGVDVLADMQVQHGRVMLPALRIRTGDRDLTPVDGRLRGSLGAVKAQAKMPSRYGLKYEAGAYLAEDAQGGILVGCGALAETRTHGNFHVQVTAPASASITVVPLDTPSLGSSRRVLITVCGRVENTDMGFSEDRRTVGTRWGRAPVCIEAVKGTVTLQAPQGWRAWALGPDGRRAGEARVVHQPGAADTLHLDPAHGTMWYLAERN